MKPGAPCGLTPAIVSDAAHASTTAGFANEVDAVNQFAAVISAAIANGVIARREPQPLMMAAGSPKPFRQLGEPDRQAVTRCSNYLGSLRFQCMRYPT